jgi:hypothetical protein
MLPSSFAQKLFGELDVLLEPAIVSDAQLCVSATRGFDHGETFVQIARHRLLAKHVDSLPEQFAGDGSVQAIGNEDNREISVANEVSEVRAPLREIVELCRATRAVGVGINDNGATHFGNRIDGGNVVAVEDGARSHDSEIQPIVHACLREGWELLAWRR